MKKLFNLLLLITMPALIYANEPGKYSKTKSIKKAYLVNPDAGIDIQNSYGSIFVTTWDEDKVDIDVQVKVSGDNEDWVNKRIDDVDVEFNGLKNLVSAKTIIGSANRGHGKNNSLEINYTIRIPKRGGVKLKNKYGNIITTDLIGNADIDCKYGRITLAKLNGTANNINIEYCSSSVIEYLKGGEINADYSKLSLNDFDRILLSADYTDVTTVKGGSVKYDSSYGKLVFGKIKDIDGIGNYLSIRAEELSGDMKINTKYSKITVENLTAGAGDISVNSQYTNVNVNYHPNYAFAFDVDVKFANFGYDKDVEVSARNDGSFSKNYKGSYKNGANNKVTIRSEYGNVKLTKI